MWYLQSATCFLAQMLMRLLLKWVPLSDSILSGVPCCHRTCFSRPRVGFQAVAWVSSYSSSHPVVTSTTVSWQCLPWQVCGSVASLTGIAATVLYTRETLLAWFNWLWCMFHILEYLVASPWLSWCYICPLSCKQFALMFPALEQPDRTSLTWLMGKIFLPVSDLCHG